MIANGTHTPVLIVGAGPSGLMMAAQLLRYGVQPVIIDSKQGPTNHSKALGVQARSLEIYRQMGLVDRVIDGGKKAKGLLFKEDGKEAAALSLENIGDGLTAFPFVLLYQQSKNERLLLDFLTQNCCPVYWGTTLLSFKQTVFGVDLKLQAGDQIRNITCNWLIGADGAHSIVRKLLQIPFSGDAYAHNFYLADVELNNVQLDEGRVQLFLSKKGFAGFFPMPETDRYRIVGNLPDEYDSREDVKPEEILPHLNNVTGYPINIVRDNWFTVYRLHHRMADKFRDGRCFLIGDAAHIHSPVGAQGMNTGLQDAYNLAWKLAGVVNNQLKELILDSYAQERMPVARDVLNTTDRIFTMITSGNLPAILFKKWILPGLLKTVWSKENFRTAFFKRISQISINYRHSSLSLHLSHASKIKAGDRLPYLKLYDEKKQEETDLHAWCSKPGFTLIIFGKFDEMFLFNIAKWITMKYPNLLNFYYFPPTGKNLDIFNEFEVNPHLQKVIIVRPDMHIGFINDTVDMRLMDNYLRNVVGIADLN